MMAVWWAAGYKWRTYVIAIAVLATAARCRVPSSRAAPHDSVAASQAVRAELISAALEAAIAYFEIADGPKERCVTKAFCGLPPACLPTILYAKQA